MLFNKRQHDKIETLIQEIILNGTITIEMFNNTQDGLLNHKLDLLQKTTKELSPKLVEREKPTERKCIEFLALWKPNAKFLRISTMLMMMNKELARIGDLCFGAATMADIYLHIDNSYSQLNGIKEIFSKTGDILIAANKSFASKEIIDSHDVFSAYSVLKMDKEINQLRDNLVKGLISEIKHYPEQVESIYTLIRIIQKLERIGDHCKNIAAEVVYIVSGKLDFSN